MSTNHFAFPPPPPPPPQRSHDSSQSTRGRGFGGGLPRGRGAPRGYGPQRGNFDGGRGRGLGYPQNSSFYRGPPLNPSFKRTHATAFSPNPQSRPRAPPAVPSFNADIETLLSSKSTQKPSVTPAAASKKTNLLGLTPADAEPSDSEDDRDEESRLVQGASTFDLNFEYKGQSSTLRTPAEIAAWIAERRKRWPTEAKREVAKKEAQDRKQKWEEEKKRRAEAFQETKKRREAERSKANAAKHPRKPHAQLPPAQGLDSDEVRAAQSRAEHLRRKALKAQQKLEAAEKALLRAGTGSRAGEAHAMEADQDLDDDSSSVLSDSSDLTASTSTSGSDSDDDSAPEQTSSKVQVDKDESSPKKTFSTKKPCQFFVKHGNCKYGTKCRYSHDVNQPPAQGSKVPKNGPKSERKGLWQVMVEKEKEEERKRVLQAIIALGKQGVLDDS